MNVAELNKLYQSSKRKQNLGHVFNALSAFAYEIRNEIPILGCMQK